MAIIPAIRTLGVRFSDSPQHSFSSLAQKTGLWLLALLVITSCAQNGDQRDYDAVVGIASAKTGNAPIYPTIAAALAAAPEASATPYVIYLPEGTYREKLLVSKPNIHLIGAGRDSTIISYGDYAGMPAVDAEPGSEAKMGTFDTATLTVEATDFRAENLTIENSFDFLATDALPKDHTDKINGTQAVALETGLSSDRTAFRNVRLLGYQDTLFVQAGRSYFVDSVVEGNVDFIFGAGQALFENSDIVTRPRGTARETVGYVTAPSTDIGNEFGLVFLNCRLLKAEGVPTNSTPLGRPWHPTTDFPDGRYADPDAIGAAVYIRSFMDDHITRDGWDSMRGTSRDGTKSTVFTPEESRFFEFENHGPGAIVNNKRRQLTEHQAAIYTRERILAGWNPDI
ncbi:pectinesterase family protein [Microbulbifer bruguierae]|uniref:Pectinesterase family protein n=1 Tax=Microbulbifer bruguierae TaxID=3029061 RepID=A0ABY8NDA7_9GAMM|nr:pectinesterase family protein [Microbulbifer bruguierae]WGL16690.1 pectinesterase family protein [Microbulbifer bruguierae]